MHFRKPDHRKLVFLIAVAFFLVGCSSYLSSNHLQTASTPLPSSRIKTTKHVLPFAPKTHSKSVTLETARDAQLTIKDLPTHPQQQLYQVNHGKAQLANDLPVSNQPFAKNSRDMYGRISDANAVADYTSLTNSDSYELRNHHHKHQEKPQGWHSVHMLPVNSRKPFELFARLHLIDTGFSNFTNYDATDYNTANVITVTHATYRLQKRMEQPLIKALRHHEVIQLKLHPVYKGDEKLCRGLQVQVKSLNSHHVNMNYFIYNAQPRIAINYFNGNITAF